MISFSIFFFFKSIYLKSKRTEVVGNVSLETNYIDTITYTWNTKHEQNLYTYVLLQPIITYRTSNATRKS